MELSLQLYLALLAAVGIGRLFELRHSRANQRRLIHAGSSKATEPGYRWMVAFHIALLVGSALEATMLHRPLIPWLAWTGSILFVAANALRWWAMRSLGARWNVQVMSISRLGVAAGGPYRWVRHPNY